MNFKKINVPIATALVVLSFLTGKIWAFSSWTTSVDMRIARIEEYLHIPSPERNHLGPAVFQNAEANETEKSRH